MLGGDWRNQNKGSRLHTKDSDDAICWFNFVVDSGGLVVVTSVGEIDPLELEFWTMVG